MGGLNRFEQQRVAYDPETPTEVLGSMDLSDFVISHALAKNPNTSPETLVRIYRTHPCLWYLLLNDPRFPAEGLRLVIETDSEMFWHVMRHPNCPTWLKVALKMEDA